MTRTHSFGKRAIALLLSLVLILSLVPATGLVRSASANSVDSGIISSVADGNTMNSWQNAFHPTNISTEHAGGVWTDKSVIKWDNVANAFGNIAGLEAGENNFLVALSALAANSVVTGQGTMPTDTVLVLDISGSMGDTDLRAMVNAANDAIHTLLTGNEKNRVGVVLYASSASVLLPLDRYNPVTDNNVIEYIEYSNSRIRAARVQTSGGNQGGPGNNQGGPGNNQNNYTYITNSSGASVTSSVSVGGGTYIQGGLYTAWEQFNAATVTDQRTPVLVLMSDGAPTFVTNDFNNVPNSYESGDGNSSGAGEGFLTQLTAAYVKEKIAAKYSTGTYTAKSYLYTLGLGLSTSDTTPSVAEAVLNTGKTRSDITAYWNTYLALASQEIKTMDVSVYEDSWWGSSTTDVTVTYDATLNSADQKAYVDKYFPASSASDLSTAFKSIVNEISLKSSYYVTRLDGQDANMGGYVTFVDEIGTGMEVKEIEGILIGNTLYTGEKLAQAMANGDFGTVENPTALGDNLVWAVVERLRITASENQTAEEIARDLLGEAYAAGQIGYDAGSGQWSNYIAWFGDKDGKFVGFWDTSDPYAPIPANAVYANACYGMLGTTTDDQTAHASDMMYVAIQVSKAVTKDANGNLSLEANTPQTVTFRVPAALLPTVTYQISVEVGSDNQIDENTKATIAYKGADPIRLVYEVGVHSELTPENIDQFVRKGYQAKDANGNYYLYTNAWNWGEDADFNNPPTKDSEVLKDTGKNAITYAYFEPGADNEHYYFVKDSLVYTDKNGTLYTGSTQPDGTKYFKHLIYTATANGSNASAAVTATVTAHYEELSEAALALTQQTSGASTWYVPADTMHRNMHSHDSDKAPNETGSFFAIRHQLVDMKVEGDATHHYEIVYMGNNGRITYAPAQGVDLTKEMAQGDTAEGQSFSFTVAVSQDADGKLTVTRNGVGTAMDLTSNKLELSLAAGETVRITGIDIGETYTITENIPDGYSLSGIVARNGAAVNNAAGTVSDTVQSNVIHAVTYTNAVVDYGSLLISKEVAYLKGSQPDSTNAVKFPVNVTLTGLGGKTIYVDGAPMTLASSGMFTFDIIDGQNMLISGIPEGTAYTVEEVTANLPKGYTATAYRFTGTVQADATQTAALKNQYEPEDVVINNVKPAVTVDVTKAVKVKLGDATGSLTGEYTFKFELQKYNAVDSKWETVKNNVAVTINNPTTDSNGNSGTAQISLADIKLDSVGDHYFRVAEVIPTPTPENPLTGWTYDRTFHDFVITVVDNGNGALVIEDVKSVQHAIVNETAEDVWNVSTVFNNSYERNSTKLTIQANKSLTNLNTNESMALKDGQFQFALYSADAAFSESSLVKLWDEDFYNGATGDVIFKTITYGTADTYYYVVKETSTNGNGYTVDGTVYKIAVTVAQEPNSSSLEITVVTVQKNDEAAVDMTAAVLAAGNILNGDTISFKNTYEATTAQVQINGEKTLSNETPGAANTTMTVPSNAFSFKLTALDGAPLAAGNTSGYEIVENNGSAFAFSQITFNQAGTYHYTVTEEAPNAPGMSKDPAVHNITVVVTDDGKSTLTATVTYNGQAVNGTTVQTGFHNTYKAAPVTDVVIKGHKDLIVPGSLNRTLKAGEFHFTLTGEGVAETVSNAANGDFAFSALRFDRIGTYAYTVTETDAGAVKNGVTYDKASYKVTVTVTDNDADGKLEANVAYEKVTAAGNESASQASFQNTYAAKSVTVQLSAHKYLTGDRDLKPGEFSFTLTKPNASPEIVSNSADGQVTFSPITYYGVGEYTYKIAENKLDENGIELQPNADGQIVYKGVTYSLRKYTVTVKVTDNGLGSLVAHVTTVDDLGNELPAQFFNRYEAQSVTVNIEGDKANTEGKTLTDKSDSSNKKTLADFNFQFVLTDEAGNVIEVASDDNVGGFRFADISFAEETVAVYYIYEQNDGTLGVTYDNARYKVTVEVTDNGDGQLEAQVTYEKVTVEEDGSQTTQKVDGVTFANTFEPDAASMQIVGNKTLTNMTPGITDKNMDVPAGKFLFKLTALDGAPLADGNTSGYEIVTTNANGRFAFSAIRYTQPGTFRYVVTEEDTDYPGVTKDSAVYNVTVVVEQKLSGRLVISITCNGEAVDGNVVKTDFANTYLAAPVAGILLEGSKELLVDSKLDRKLNAGDFEFVLTMPDGKTTTVTNDADGNFRFTVLNFNQVGSYTFKIAEKYAGTTKDGVTYDSKVFTVVVDVIDDGSGKLYTRINGLKTTSYEVGTFRNTYSAEPVTVNLTGENDRDGVKVLEDKTSLIDKNLKDYEFKFVLTDAEGNVIEVVSDNDSGFNFADFTYSEPTEKVYYIYEINEGAPAVAYDSARYQVTVKITDGLKGKLVADVTYEKLTVDQSGAQVVEKTEEVKFQNTYEADPTTVLINGTKTLTNVTPGITDKNMAVPAGKFFFKLTALNGAPLAAGNTSGYEIVTNDGDGRFGFSVIDFTKEGTYKYTITEEDIPEGTLPGVSKDGTVHTLTVAVTDNAGKLTAAVTYDGTAVVGNTVETAFHNTYLAAPVTGIVFSGSKELLVDEKLDHPMKAGDFSFILTMPDGSKKTVSNDAVGKFAFPAMDFSAVGTYTFTVAEENGGTKKDGITYDDTVVTLILQVEDNSKGQLVAKIDGKEISGYHVGTFRNTYTVDPVKINLTGENDRDGSKTLEDKTSLVDKTLADFVFRFVLTDSNGGVIETVTDNGSGFNFADITIDAPTQKVYFIYELDEKVPGVIYDNAKYKIIVKTTDNGKGLLDTEVTYEKITVDAAGKETVEKADQIAFANTYEAKATAVSFAGIKTLNGGRKLKAGEFSFILSDAAGKELETVTNGADGKFTFTAISYTQEGTYVYTLAEVKGADDKVTYDGTKYTLTVTVTDVNGELKAATQITVDEKAADSFGFTNLFTPANADIKVTVEKVLENKSDEEMGLNGFQFDLTCVETGKLISAISGVDGLAEMELSFSAADIGKTYTYLLTEHKGDVEGMTYSDTVYEIKIAVSQDAESGELVLTVTRDGKAVTENAKFINTYNKETPPDDTPDTPPEEEIPKTGEGAFVELWSGMMSVSAICLLAVLVLGKKKTAEQ